LLALAALYFLLVFVIDGVSLVRQTLFLTCLIVLILEIITKDIIKMLNYYRSIQRRRNSYHINLPKSLIDILDLKKGQVVNISLASEKGEKVVVIRTVYNASKEAD
jgi:hypothetical protein